MPVPDAGDVDPGTVATVEQFALQLRRLHVRAGRPSLRQLERWAQAQNAAGRREVSLTRSSVSDALNGRRLPRKDFVRWFTEACSVPVDQRQMWLTTWERVADHQFVSGPATVETPPPPALPVGDVQPLSVDLMVVTVFMKGRSVHRRVTERLITARENGVAHFIARGYVGNSKLSTFSAVRALWGCEAQALHPGQAGGPATRLTFPAPLRAGEKAHFASEMIVDHDVEQRDWIEVTIDHHGIARGDTVYGGLLPTSGLTIRVRFDDGHVPDAVWWYARRGDDRPAEDERTVAVVGRDVQHTFDERPCKPGEFFGLAFAWPAENA